MESGNRDSLGSSSANERGGNVGTAIIRAETIIRLMPDGVVRVMQASPFGKWITSIADYEAGEGLSRGTIDDWSGGRKEDL
jgi:hypothetical protein